MPYCIRLQLIKDLHSMSQFTRQDSDFSDYEESEKLQCFSTKYLLYHVNKTPPSQLTLFQLLEGVRLRYV